MRLIDFDLQHLEDVPAVVGVDEAGRGPLAGPVSAAAVYLDRNFYVSDWAAEYGSEINDSKQLKEWEKFQEEAAKRDHRKLGRVSSIACRSVNSNYF